MKVLVVGGSASGKSAYAEDFACSLSPIRTYLATMSPLGAEAQERIGRHRAQRASKGFVTVERNGSSLLPVDGGETGVRKGVVLLEDLGNLVANALFGQDGVEDDPAFVVGRLEQEVLDLARSYEHVVVVGNEVGSEGASAFAGTRMWVCALGELSCRLASNFDMVVEVSAGVACVVKGGIA